MDYRTFEIIQELIAIVKNHEDRLKGIEERLKLKLKDEPNN